jgi:SAM-dependent methyltransferase
VEKSPSIFGTRSAPVKPEPITLAEPLPGWEEPDCLLCGNRQREVVVRAYDNAAPDDWHRYTVVRCVACGLCFTSPRPSPELIGKFYPDWYEPHQSPSECRSPPWWSRLAARLGWQVRPRRILPWHGRGRLLDFGCGGGSFLQRMHRLGWEVTGLDISPPAIERIRTQFHLRAMVGSLPHPELVSGSFDVVTMWQSLEHVHNPRAALRATHQLLTPGGRLLIAVPNIAGLPFRWFGPTWYALDLPRHLTHFTPSTLCMMLQQCGFCVRRVSMLRHHRWLRESARLTSQGSASADWRCWLGGKVTSRLITSLCWLTRRSDCMLVAAERGAT